MGPEDERLEGIYERLEELDPTTFEARVCMRRCGRSVVSQSFRVPAMLRRQLTIARCADRRVQRSCSTAWASRRSRWQSARGTCQEAGACASRLHARFLLRPRCCCSVRAAALAAHRVTSVKPDLLVMPRPGKTNQRTTWTWRRACGWRAT